MELKMDHTLILAENLEFETLRLYLRPVLLTDAPDITRFIADDLNYRYNDGRKMGLQDIRHLIAKRFMADPLGKYAMIDKERQQVIGLIDLAVEPAREVGELGFVIKRDYWGEGYTSEAAVRLLDLAFCQLNLIRVYSSYDALNTGYDHALNQIGMKEESYIPSYRRFQGQSITQISRGITKEEWKKMRQSRLIGRDYGDTSDY